MLSILVFVLIVILTLLLASLSFAILHCFSQFGLVEVLGRGCKEDRMTFFRGECCSCDMLNREVVLTEADVAAPWYALCNVSSGVHGMTGRSNDGSVDRLIGFLPTETVTLNRIAAMRKRGCSLRGRRYGSWWHLRQRRIRKVAPLPGLSTFGRRRPYNFAPVDVRLSLMQDAPTQRHAPRVSIQLR